jgi:hypothetical protein
LSPREPIEYAPGGSCTFSKGYRIADGLGPVFNEVACVACHGVEAGRAGNRRNTHFGLRNEETF